jgi:hypothetical protein
MKLKVRIETLSHHCETIFADKKNYELQSEYNYAHLGLCVIDSIYSIGVKYEGVQNTVKRFCEHFAIDRFNRSKELSISEFINYMNKQSLKLLTEDIFQNKQRTSTKSGILKSEAVLLFLNVLKKYKVEYFHDLDKVINSDEFEKEIKLIPGQKSGISLKYFFMLAGSDDLIKPDRMILRFIQNNSTENITINDCQFILTEVVKILNSRKFNLTAKKLDNIIWNYQRSLTS